MAVLPEGFALPPLPYLLALLAGLGAVAFLLSRRRPPVTERLVLALAPWMVLGSALHVLYALGALPDLVRPLAGTPAVYLTVAVVAGATWIATAAAVRDPPRVLGALGAVASIVTVALAAAAGQVLRIVPLLAILVGAAVATAVTWALLRRLRPGVSVTGRVGLLAVAAHALDGVSTAVGIDLLGFSERTPLSRHIIEFAASLPTADLIGGGWLFVLVKLVVVAAIVAAFAETVREAPAEGRLFLGFVTAVGLGPGTHNLILFAVAG
ncbi:DUF63 family protein [Haloplanus halobius]|uniref:DUF63 family protein n=1 Tax=Haloplanus halobius TaxID=2934938 RepID=UPI00200E0614|nr:DUF63 family protein [Haloplanus sp. XH21]